MKHLNFERFLFKETLAAIVTISRGLRDFFTSISFFSATLIFKSATLTIFSKFVRDVVMFSLHFKDEELTALF